MEEEITTVWFTRTTRGPLTEARAGAVLNFKFEYRQLALAVVPDPGWIAGHSWHEFEQAVE